MGGWDSYRCSETGEGIVSHEEHEWTRKKPCEWFAPLRNGRLRGVFLNFAMVGLDKKNRYVNLFPSEYSGSDGFSWEYKKGWIS